MPRGFAASRQLAHGAVRRQICVFHSAGTRLMNHRPATLTAAVRRRLAGLWQARADTGSAFEHYDDRVEHSLWLSLMRDRLQVIRRLLSEDGSLWITIDDNEAHNLKVLGDEVFWRTNLVCQCHLVRENGPDNGLPPGDAHDHILVLRRVRKPF
jgi:hypothetical protein